MPWCDLVTFSASGTGAGWLVLFFFQAEDGIRDWSVTGVQTCALPICMPLYLNATQSAVDAEEPCIDRALRRVQIKRHADTDAKPYEDEISDDLDLRRTDGHLREQHEADRQNHGPNGSDIAVALDAHHELPGHDAGADQTDHQRSDQETRICRRNSEDALIYETHENDRPEHREPEEEPDDRRHGVRRALTDVGRHDRMPVAPLDDEEDHGHDRRDAQKADHLRRGDVVVLRDGQSNEQRDQGRRQGEGHSEVDVSPRSLVRDVGKSHEADEDRENAKGQVQVEDPE